MIVVPSLIATVTILAVRIVLTVAFTREAMLKLKDIPKFAKNDEIPVPLAWFVAIAELTAAVSFATGFLSQLAGLGVIVLMLITTSMHVFKWKSSYWAQKGGPEYDLMLLVLAAVIVAFGPGSLAITL
ncbi:MAG TPA: DoxX family protein [Microbacteriaceae bacterium]|nr:DoxX family protein [Microbacteriaceae bacterium]